MIKFCKTVMHIAVLYGIFLIGAGIQNIFHLFIPGSVIGMILLFVLLMTGIVKDSWIELGANFFINYLVLFFVPATVGVMNYLDLFKGKGFLLIIIVLISTVLVMGGTGVISQWIARRREAGAEHE